MLSVALTTQHKDLFVRKVVLYKFFEHFSQNKISNLTKNSGNILILLFLQITYRHSIIDIHC